MTVQSFFHDGPADYPILDWSGYNVRATRPDARPWPPAHNDIKSILIIKYDAYGDYILHTPFYAHLRKFYPNAKITLLCNAATYELAQHDSSFDHITPATYFPGYNQSEAFMFALELQNHAAAPFDLVIVPRWGEEWHHAGAIAQTLDAPYRLTYAGDTLQFKAENFPQHDDYFTHVIADKRPTHEVWRGMQILHALGAPMPPIETINQKIYTSAADAEKIETLFSNQDYPRPWIAFGVGASADFKCWPAEHFAELAEQISQKIGGTILLFGHGAKDEAAAATIQNKNPNSIVNLVGQINPRETALAISKCNAMVCNDSFTLHAAATHGVPIVEVVSQPMDGNPNSEYVPWYYGPWGAPFAWVQPLTCNRSKNAMTDFRGDPKCIADVPPNHVFMVLTEVLRKWPK